MPTISDTAVCLRHWDFSETSQTVSLFGREYGILRGLAKGAKRERGAFSGGLDILTRGQVVAIVKRGRDLSTLTEWHLEETFRALHHRLDANRAGLFMADLVSHMVTDGDPHPALFDALVAALRALAVPDGVGLALLGLQWTLLTETGYRPDLAHDPETGAPLTTDGPPLAFDPRQGGFVSAGPGADRWRVRGATVELLRRLAAGDDLAGAAAESVARANRLLASYAREIIGRELPSMPWAFPEIAAGRIRGGPGTSSPGAGETANGA